MTAPLTSETAADLRSQRIEDLRGGPNGDQAYAALVALLKARAAHTPEVALALDEALAVLEDMPMFKTAS